jgi:hypothetical protein
LIFVFELAKSFLLETNNTWIIFSFIPIFFQWIQANVVLKESLLGNPLKDYFILIKLVVDVIQCFSLNWRSFHSLQISSSALHSYFFIRKKWSLIQNA